MTAQLPEDQLDELIEGQDRIAGIMESMAARNQRVEVSLPPIKIPPASVVVNPAPIIPPANVTVTHAKGWKFKITHRDQMGRIEEFTATPMTYGQGT